jgi:alkanesulfonate monooxygenase SsuD/methylene tetrahydromethanopterin reductase-like flavin-dependent oxidoreductase (luciferase family)
MRPAAEQVGHLLPRLLHAAGPGSQMPCLASSGFAGAGWQDAAMRYSVNVPNFGEFAAPEVFAEVARRAEEAGWDALLVWDHVVGEKDLRWEIADPWILLAAAALATSRIRLGTAVTPVARRRPSKLAREVTTLDQLTGGRMILGAGLGDPVDGEYGSFGDTTDTKVLAERLDEGLHALALLWSGEPVTYRGNQVTVDDVVFCRSRCSVRGCRSGSAGSGRTRRRCAGQRDGTGPSPSWPGGTAEARRTSARSRNW